MNVEADFIKEALDAGLYKHTTRITSSILLQTSDIVHRNMAIQATLKDNLGRVFYSLNEGLRDMKSIRETFMPLITPPIKNIKEMTKPQKEDKGISYISLQPSAFFPIIVTLLVHQVHL